MKLMRRMKTISQIRYLLHALILYALITITNQVPLDTPIACQSRLLQLYNSTQQLPASTTSNFTQLFNVTFVDLPVIAISNAGYYSLDQLYNQLWGVTYTTFTNLTGMRIQVRCEINTKTNVIFVSYFAVDGGFEPGLFQMYSVLYTSTQLVILLLLQIHTSAGSGNRTDTIRYQPTPITYFNTNSYIYHVTNILYMRNSATFNFIISVDLYLEFNSTVNQTFSTSFTITVYSSETRLENVGLWIIVLNPNTISYENYYQAHVGTVTITSTNTSIVFYSLNVTDSSVGVSEVNISDIWRANIMMGFSTWGSEPYLGSGFKWALLQDINGTANIKIFNPNRIGKIKYNFFIFGKVDCPYYWSVVNQSCVNQCASNEVVHVNKPSCLPCSMHCTTCSIIPRNCTGCQNGYYLVNNTCNLCEETLKLAICGYVPYQPPTPTPTLPNLQNSPFWLICLILIPLAAVGILCYCRYKKIHSTIALQKASSFKQHPSMEF